MIPEKYVKQFYPDSFCDYSNRHKKYCVAIDMEGEQVIIGESEFFERIAWKNAKDYILSLPKNQKPKLIT